MTSTNREPQPSTRVTSTAKVPISGVALTIYADGLDDLEDVRIRTQNRARSLEQVKGMEGTREHRRVLALVENFAHAEHEYQLLLQGAMRRHPLGPWVEKTIGVGLKQGARLLAAIGDPYWHAREDRPRLVSELWAYCGYHVVTPQGERRRSDGDDPDQGSPDSRSTGVGVAPSRKRGQQANWNDTARMRAYLIAESCIKQRTSPYRTVYDEGRAKYVDAVHESPCKRCGPSGKPAVVGSELSDGHKHARALRLVAKAVLRDLWQESKRLHEEQA